MLAGCSGATPDRSEAAEQTPASGVTSAGAASEGAPEDSADDMQSASDSGAAVVTTQSASSAPEREEATSDTDQNAAPEAGTDESEMQPSLQAPPEPALSDDEIRETYGAEEPEPAEPVAGTLCNLSRSHVENLSAQIVSDGVIDDGMLRLAALSLSDDLGVWEGISWQLPELDEELDTARQIYSHWEFAIGLVDVGDTDAALAQLNIADGLIADLPGEDVAEVGC